MGLKEKMKAVLAEKKRLEATLEVQQYLKCLEQIQSWGGDHFKDILEMNDQELTKKAWENESIVDSNRICICMGTYIAHRTGDILVSRERSDADYRIYQDIEKPVQTASTEVPISQCEKFERSHFIFYPSPLEAKKFYQTLQNQFFKLQF